MQAHSKSLEERLRHVEDMLEIHQLIAAYGPAADSCNLDAMEKIWQADCTYDLGAVTFQGMSQLKQGTAGFKTSMAGKGSAHAATMPYVVIEGDKATATHYTTLITSEGGAYTLQRISASRWDLARTAEGWRVAARTLRPLDGNAAAAQVLAECGLPPAQRRTPEPSARRRHAPHRVADVIGHQQRAARVQRHAHRPPMRIAAAGHEAAEHLHRRA